MRRNNRSQRGFTLIELIIVIAILGLIMVLLNGGLSFAGRAWDTQERRLDRAGDVNAVQNVLRQLVASGHAFEGDSASLHFVTALPRALARGGLYDVQLVLDDDRLVLAWNPHFKGSMARNPPTRTELLKNVDHIDFGYLLAAKDSTVEWQSVAKDRDKPPALVRIVLATKDGVVWPPFVVAPMIDIAPGTKSAGGTPTGQPAQPGQPQSPQAPQNAAANPNGD